MLHTLLLAVGCRTYSNRKRQAKVTDYLHIRHLIDDSDSIAWRDRSESSCP